MHVSQFNKSRFDIVVASLHHPTYGFDSKKSSPDIRDHFLCIHKSANATPKEFKLIKSSAKRLKWIVNLLRDVNSSAWVSEDTGAKNFFTVMDHLAIPQIGETMILPGDEMVVILKTVWIRLLQRTWKKICARRREILRKRCKPHSIQERERSGAWPNDCRDLPGLRGMMAGC